MTGRFVPRSAGPATWFDVANGSSPTRRMNGYEPATFRRVFSPLAEAGVLEFVDEDVEVVPGITVVRTPGHTPYHQSVIVRAGGHMVFYPADLAPTSAHLRLPWIMGYDVEPLVTLESKRTWLTRAGAENWHVVFCHDPKVATGVARPRDNGGCELTDVRCDGE